MFQCNRCGEAFSKYRSLYQHKEFENWVNAGGDAFGSHAKVTTAASTDNKSSETSQNALNSPPNNDKGETNA